MQMVNRYIINGAHYQESSGKGKSKPVIHHLTPIRKVIKKTKKIISVGKDVEKRVLLYTLAGM